ncbi:MAG: hypothetical protein COX40_01815 [Candidatus Omnitrophica bacterium CG23_combo_of_CG06-09_8_20_14_all_40_11]|nr:MAG: hypothetical protein COX40_01815 [Candidatus Omnitrophica bacterium CG23_combo_of_CG06-09_8_20_14_all_40_11]
MKIKKSNNILRFLKLVYIKLFRVHDTPQRIALGVGIGVSLGIMPGTGPIAAIFMALVLRVNRAAALLGSLATNTWLSILTFFLSIKIGSSIMGVHRQDVHRNWVQFLKDFKFVTLFKLATLKIILPVIIGYLVVSFCLGLIAYLVTWIIITKIRNESKSRINISF